MGCRGPARVLLFIVLPWAACTTTSNREAPPAPAPAVKPRPPDEQALARETRVTAREVKLVLSERWRGRARIRAKHQEVVGAVGAIQVSLGGPVVFDLQKLHVEAADAMHISWLGPDHDNILLHARDVALFQQTALFGHRAENVAAVLMADDVVSFFQQ